MTKGQTPSSPQEPCRLKILATREIPAGSLRPLPPPPDHQQHRHLGERNQGLRLSHSTLPKQRETPGRLSPGQAPVVSARRPAARPPCLDGLLPAPSKLSFEKGQHVGPTVRAKTQWTPSLGHKGMLGFRLVTCGEGDHGSGPKSQFTGSSF